MSLVNDSLGTGIRSREISKCHGPGAGWPGVSEESKTGMARAGPVRGAAAHDMVSGQQCGAWALMLSETGSHDGLWGEQCQHRHTITDLRGLPC